MQQLKQKGRTNGSLAKRNDTRERHCRRCNQPGHIIRTCNIDADISLESDSAQLLSFFDVVVKQPQL